MTDGIASGVFALAGAGVGGVFGIVTSLVTARDRRREADRSRTERIGDLRRVRYARLVEGVDVFLDQLRELHSMSSVAQVPPGLVQRYQEQWLSLVEASAAVELVGPGTVGTEVERLRRLWGETSELIDGWLASGRWGEKTNSKYLELRAAIRQGRTTLLESMQQTLSDD